jgi:hypothetical protein
MEVPPNVEPESVMPRLAFSTSVAAGATYRPLQGWTYEYLPWRALVRLLAWTTAVGVVCQANSGSEQLQPECPIDIGAGAAGNLPTTFEVDPLVFMAPGGDRLDLAIRNTTGGALNVMGFVDVNPA